MKWFFVSVVVTISLLFMYYKIDASKANMGKVLDEQIALVKKKVQVIQGQSNLMVPDEDMSVEEEKIERNTLREEDSPNMIEDDTKSSVPSKKDEEVINRIEENIRQTSVTSNVEYSVESFANKPTKVQCLENGGGISSVGECVAKWKEANNICSDMNSRLYSLTELHLIIKKCTGTIGNGYEEILRENLENEYYHACYVSKGFYPYEFWTSTQSEERSQYYAYVVHFGNGSSYEGYKLNNMGVRCVKE